MQSELMDPGVYTGRVLTAKVTVARTGNPQMEIECQLTNPDGSDTAVGVKAYLSLTEAARASFVDAKLAEMGFNGDFEAPEFGKEAYEQIELTCEHDNYQGKKKEKWSLGRGGAAPAGRDVLNRLNADWRSKNAPSRPPQGRPTPPAARPAMPTRKGGAGPVDVTTTHDDLTDPPF